jgi:hypothetical protein
MTTHRPVIANVYISQPNKNNQNYYIGYSKGTIVNTKKERGINDIESYEQFTNSVGLVDIANGESRASPNAPDGYYLAAYVNVGFPNDNNAYDFIQIRLNYIGEDTIQGVYPGAGILEGKASLFTPDGWVSSWEGVWYKEYNSYKDYERYGRLIRIERTTDDGYFGNFNIYIDAHKNL